MGLTSPVLPYLLAAAAALLLLAMIFWWPRLARTGVWPVALRVVSLCVLQALALGLIFVIVNNSGEFYASWSDLLGSDSGAAKLLAPGGGPAHSQRQFYLSASAAVKVPGSRQAGGTLESVRLYGQLSGLGEAGHVFLPAGYKARGSRLYPVLVTISDAPAAGQSPYAARRLAQSAAIEIAASRMQPMIIVMLPATVAAGDRACLNLPPTFKAGRTFTPAIQGETFFAQDLPGIIESNYRASSKPGNWALLGDQAGGYCALQLAMDNSYVFSAAVAPPASYTQPPGNPPGLDSSQLRQQDNLVWQLGNLPMQQVSVLFAGTGFAPAGDVQPFVSLAQRPMKVSLAQLSDGSWPLAPVLRWISTTIGSQGQVRV